MDKLDLSKKYKTYFAAKTRPEIAEIEPAQFLSVTGKGDPSDKAFSNKVQALFTTAYAVKFIFKPAGKDFTVSKLECLWWYDEKQFPGISISEAPVKVPRSEWEYRLLIRMPEYVTKQEVEKGIQAAVSKKKLSIANEIEFYKMTEGKCVQMLHVDSFEREPETLKQIGEFISANQFKNNGLHHEIYLSNFDKTAPEKLKTILREPVK